MNGVGDQHYRQDLTKFEAKKSYSAGICFQVKETYLAENKSLPSYIIDLEEGNLHSDVLRLPATWNGQRKIRIMFFDQSSWRDAKVQA